MEGLALAASVTYQLGTNAAFLFLCALGLIIILGMMNIINLAHGELMMMGAYIATLSVQAGIPFPVGVILAFIVTAAFGAVLEQLVVRRFYGTWVVSGNVLTRLELSVDRIDLSDRSFGGYYALQFNGTGNAGGSGYYRATPLAPEGG